MRHCLAAQLCLSRLDYKDTERMNITDHATAVYRHTDYGWALNDKMVQKVIVTHIAVVAFARAVPETLHKVRTLDPVAVAVLAKSGSRENRKGAEIARRVGGLAPYYASLIYRAIRLGEDSCELAEEFQTTPWAIRQTLYRLNQTAQKIEAGENLLRRDFLTVHRRRGVRGPRPRWDLNAAIPLRQAGFSYVEIAAKFGLSASAVCHAFRKAGIVGPKVIRTRPTIQKYSHVECIELRRAGWKTRELADRYGVTVESILGCIARHRRRSRLTSGPVVPSVESVAPQSSTPTPQQ